MPFGCVTLGDKKDYNQPSEVTDRYDLGQVIKTLTPKYAPEIFPSACKLLGLLGCGSCPPGEVMLGGGGDLFGCSQSFVLSSGEPVPKPVGPGSLTPRVTAARILVQPGGATGREVFDWILDQGYYSERDTSNVIRQVLEAVAYLHSLKIVHRNLKLENLVYYNRLKNSKIVISDFHLAKLENGLIKEPCGTPEYLAPEVVGRQRYGRPVDCWAIGVIMYILLSGNPPFYEEADE
ncbi:CAMKV protein, partial [Ciccaba nigrolineata]|nr:CAMKV protein [Ciccaba nigrolineata]